MDARVQKAIQQSIALHKDPGSVPWKSDEPWAQSHYAWDAEEEAWQPASTSDSDSSSSSPSTTTTIRALALYSWNIDFMLPFAESRMEAALSHLSDSIAQLPSSTAAVVFLQECVPSDLATISRQPWVRSRFSMTDLDASAWGNGAYGTTTLVDRKLGVAACFRVHYAQTRMERDALFVDAVVPGIFKPGQILRLCNTHLESLLPDPPLRPPQMRLVSTFLRASEVSGGIAAGDFNAIQPVDRTLHSAHGLRDAYLELGGREDSDEGYTWGQQALRPLREQFGCSRMDKAFFCGAGLELQSFERVGADVEVRGERQRSGLLALGFEKAWVTDHLGIKAVFNLKDAVHS
ncbi:endonuclease/exonuclease/phosphatase family protein [Xylaria bambusicola]|uniref:endonuclease/exonuclease/phosphatase family protein n=1 Tax=Xylaria bambusicola TaxID=326684 RepID=UPI0020088CAF|nr:endonuclease/exonuclease/phosphatase family protein [Xylaria bambusicola]KAI0516693.1 endonuclease/exonuclease/phosphatase family protein [Xylaria bambusicola]